MTTARKLWLGFGTLIGLLVLSSVAITLRVWSIDAQVGEMARARNLSATTAQLETNVLAYVLGVRTYLQTGDATALQASEEDAAAVERNLLEYERLATTAAGEVMADHFVPMWREVQILGEALVDPDNRELKLVHSKRLYELRTALEKLLDGEMQVEANDIYNNRRDAAVRDTQTIVGFTLILLAVGTLIAVATSLAVGRRVIENEHQLWASREQLRVTLASIGDAVITTDTQGKVTYLNAVAECLTGWSNDAAAGKALATVFHIVNEHSRKPVDNPALKALSEGIVVGLANHTVLIARDGSEHPIDDSAAPIRDEQGQVAGVVLIFRDVTERNRLENELRQNAADLSEADRRKDEFLAMLAHELRNPLAPISNALHVMRSSGGSGTTAATATTMMERQVGQIVRLVDDLLDVSRISRGKIELRKGRIELASVVHHAVEAAGPQFASKDHDLTVTLPSQPVYLDADPARLAQVVGNLLNNAAKFTDPGGRIALTVERGKEHVAIRVRDSGIGIAAEQLPRIFDLFAQADTSLGRTESGIGIGLSLVKKLVELHDGTVAASSPGLGAGSEFLVYLPIIGQGPDAVPQQPRVGEPGMLPPRRILVVDDNQDSAASMAALLELDSHETHIAWDGVAAVDAAASWLPDVVLLDIGLPGLNGYEVARRIREQPWGKRMVLVAVTGWGQEADRSKSRDAGFDAHLVKPASHASIVRVLTDFPPAAV
ncbi:MAG: ATP-binding protein [Panacagrimonas sp.]